MVYVHILVFKTISPINAEWCFPILSIGPVHFRFKGRWVVLFNFIQILIEHSIRKPRPDATFCGVQYGLHCLPISHKKDARLTVSSLDLKKAYKE